MPIIRSSLLTSIISHVFFVGTHKKYNYFQDIRMKYHDHPLSIWPNKFELALKCNNGINDWSFNN